MDPPPPEQAPTQTPEDILGEILNRQANIKADVLFSTSLSTTRTKKTDATSEGVEEQEQEQDAAERAKQQELQGLQELESTLALLKEDAQFAQVQPAYEKLLNLYKTSRSNETNLFNKCQELTTEITSSTNKIQAAMKLSQNDHAQISSLKKELAKAWSSLETNEDKEKSAREAMNVLKNELDNLKAFVASQGIDIGLHSTSSNTTSNNSNNSLVELIKEKEELSKQNTSLNDQVNSLRSTNIDLGERVGHLATEKSVLSSEVNSLKDMISAKKTELDREVRQREKLEIMLKLSNDTITKKDTELTNRFNEMKLLKESITKLEAQGKEDKTRADKADKEKDSLHSKLNRLQQEYEEQVLTTTKLLNENHRQGAELKQWEEDLHHLKEQIRAMTRMKDQLTKRIKSLEDAKSDAERDRDHFKATTVGLEKDMEVVARDRDFYHKRTDELTREIEMSHKNFVKATGATQKQSNLAKMTEQAKRTLEHEIIGYKEEANKMRKLIYSLEKERDRYISDCTGLTEQMETQTGAMKLMELDVFDQRKKIAELEKKLKEQQQLYENVRTDRNVYSKNLIEAQDEIAEMKRKLKIMAHQIEQFKEEIVNKESALVKEHFEQTKLEKEKEALTNQISKLTNQIEQAQTLIKNQSAEETKLLNIIAQADVDRLKQKKDFDAVVQERDILGTQLIRRNDELALLYEKIKIQSSTLNKGEVQYRERLEDIRVLKLEIKKLRREKAILQNETQHIDGLKGQVFKLQKEILRERTRVKVLEEELESPMNIHRWRKLAGSDPSTFELVTKVQTLQKRLIGKTEQVVEKELLIQQKEKLYHEIKDLLARQPGPEIYQELKTFKEMARIKGRECKSLASELNMYHSQVNEYKFEVERLNREVQEMRKKYYEGRKKGNVMKREGKLGRVMGEMGRGREMGREREVSSSVVPGLATVGHML